MEILTINDELLAELKKLAQGNERRRQNFDLRTTQDDTSQRMLNVLEPGTVLFEAKDGPYEPLLEEDILR